MFNEDPGAWLQRQLDPVGAYLRRGAFAMSLTGEVNYEGVLLNRALNREGG